MRSSCSAAEFNRRRRGPVMVRPVSLDLLRPAPCSPLPAERRHSTRRASRRSSITRCTSAELTISSSQAGASSRCRTRRTHGVKARISENPPKDHDEWPGFGSRRRHLRLLQDALLEQRVEALGQQHKVIDRAVVLSNLAMFRIGSLKSEHHKAFKEFVQLATAIRTWCQQRHISPLWQSPQFEWRLVPASRRLRAP
jgi:hypothetical protein